MKVPEDIVSFVDGIAGVQCHRLSDGGDFVVRRADDIISYQLAVVVDDALMGITHVPEEPIYWTPRHVSRSYTMR